MESMGLMTQGSGISESSIDVGNNNFLVKACVYDGAVFLFGATNLLEHLFRV
jgi:hypothetical protein